MLLLIYAVTIAWSFLQVSADCPPNFRKLGSGCYNFVNISTDWQHAQDICHAFSSHLVAIETETESTILKGTLLIDADSTFHPWTDAYRQSGHWIWKSSNTPIVYTDWLPGQPDGAPNDHCLRLDGDFGYKWNDHDCVANHHKFICETTQLTNAHPPVLG